MATALQPWQVLLAAMAGWIYRHQQVAIEYLREENRILLEQLGGRRLRLTDEQRRRLAVAGKAVGRRALADLACLFSPDTILAGHRKLVAAKWDQSKAPRGPGRPGVLKEIERLVIRMAHENPRWGYSRIEGALANLGYRVARTTIANILSRNGMDPAPERGRRTSWSTFLGAHWATIAAIDFTTVEMWGRRGLVTMYVLLAIDLRSRRVYSAGLTSSPKRLGRIPDRFDAAKDSAGCSVTIIDTRPSIFGISHSALRRRLVADDSVFSQHSQLDCGMGRTPRRSQASHANPPSKES